MGFLFVFFLLVQNQMFAEKQSQLFALVFVKQAIPLKGKACVVM